MISIIVPVYNGEKYIERCIESLINNKDVEIIIINDGSTDGTAKKIEKYKKNERLKIIYQENQGVSVARNNGIEIAKGDYIMFCDADDSYDENVINNISRQIRKGRPDLIVFGRKDIQNSKVISIYNIKKIKEDNLNYINYMEKFFCNGVHTYSVCNKVYRADIIKRKNIKFKSGVDYSEDTLFNLDYIPNCTNIEVVEDCYYLRYCNEGSAIYRKFKDFYWKNIKIIDSFSTKKKEEKKAMEELYKHYAIVSIYRICDGIDEESPKEDINNIRNIINDIQSRNIIMENANGRRDQILYFLMNNGNTFLIYLIFNKMRKIHRCIQKGLKKNENK